MSSIAALPRRLAPLLRFRRADGGVAALEFALILPLLLTIYVGSVEVTDGLAVKRKVSHAASAISDLVAQTSAISGTAEMTDIFNAGSAILAPYAASSLKVTVTAITMDSNKNATVLWGQALNGATCPAKGTAVAVPTDLQAANGFLVLVKAEYPYKPTIGYVLSGTYNIKDQLYQAPRTGKTITGPSCG